MALSYSTPTGWSHNSNKMPKKDLLADSDKETMTIEDAEMLMNEIVDIADCLATDKMMDKLTARSIKVICKAQKDFNIITNNS